MKLDPRIKSIDSIRCFNTNNDDCLGKFGYFTNYVTNFDDLSLSRKGICVFKDGQRFPFYADTIENQRFQYFIPKEDLLSKPKEKQFRPYTIVEFCLTFKIGQPIRFRNKETKCDKFVIFSGYELLKDGWSVMMGNYDFTLEHLFNKYEWQKHDTENYTEDYQPFGVEE